jgi:hypothetical protein
LRQSSQISTLFMLEIWGVWSYKDKQSQHDKEIY